MATRYLDFKSTDLIRDVNLGTNLFPQRLCHRRSHVVIPSLKAGILLPYLDIFDSDSCPCWQKRALSLPNDIQNAPAYIVSQNSMQISCLDHISPPHSTPYETSLLPSSNSNANRPRLLQPASDLLQSSVKTLVAQRRERMDEWCRLWLYAANGTTLRQHAYVYN